MIKKYKKLDYNAEDLESLSNSDLKKVADYWLRQYLLNSKDINPRYCPIKKKHFSISDMQVSHFFDRSILSLRFNLVNCHLISKFSNENDSKIMVDGYKSLHHKEYEFYLIETYGQEEFDKLKKMSKELRLFKKEDYIEIINKFKSND